MLTYDGTICYVISQTVPVSSDIQIVSPPININIPMLDCKFIEMEGSGTVGYIFIPMEDNYEVEPTYFSVYKGRSERTMARKLSAYSEYVGIYGLQVYTAPESIFAVSTRVTTYYSSIDLRN